MSASEIQLPQTYSQEDVQQILQLAIARKTHQTDELELSREQLWEIGAELDIEPNCLQAAELDWLNQKILTNKRQAFDVYRRERLKNKAIYYLIVNTFLIFLNLVNAGTLSWSLYVLLGWGLFLVLESWKTLQTQGEDYEQAFQRWNMRQETKRFLESLWDRLKKAWQT